MLFDAIEFAVRAHRGHFRKGSGIPYIVHPLRVAEILIRHGSAEPIAIAAVLHDTVEDTSVTLGEIRARFGDEVARLVEGASEPDKTAPWEERKRHTLEALASAPEDILLLACADKLDNLRSMREDRARLGEAFWERFNAPRERQAWYCRALAGVLERRLSLRPGAALASELRVEVEAVFGDGREG